MNDPNKPVCFFNKKTNRIEYYRISPSSDFWADHKGDITVERMSSHNKDPFILNNTRKYISSGLLLETGCGAGGPLYTLHSNNYSAIGLDFAKKTLINIKNILPYDFAHLQEKTQ